jgi:hypothetical protein
LPSAWLGYRDPETHRYNNRVVWGRRTTAPSPCYRNIDLDSGGLTPTLLGFYLTRSGYSQTAADAVCGLHHPVSITLSNNPDHSLVSENRAIAPPVFS